LLAAFIACRGGEGPESQEIGKDFEGGFFLMKSNFFKMLLFATPRPKINAIIGPNTQINIVVK
jgi:hypothetical protein